MYEVKIERLDHLGRGIGYIENKITFIPNTLPSELVVCQIVKERKKYNVGKLIEIIEPSKKRVTPFCPFYNHCGGCHLEHLNYEASLEYKEEKVKNIFKIDKVEVIKNEHPKNYRNKITLKVRNKKIGFYESQTNTLVQIKACFLANESINEVIKRLNKLNIKNGEIIIRCNTNQEILLIINTKEEIKFIEEEFKGIKLVGVLLNNQTLYGQNFFYERIHGLLFKISYDAFFQINPYIVDKLFGLIEQELEASKTILDLYSGVGTLGMVASNKAEKVISIELIKNAVLDNIQNAKLNKKTNIYPVLGDASQTLSKIKEPFDFIMVDPPRKGLDKSSLTLLLKSKAKKIIYISCDPMTLKRDLEELKKEYNIEKFYILDMFSYTYHIESFCVLKKK
ncbi:MAG: class I SAM-dependent RNA methyltransferase [Bacilli bacterium]|nr:class I SAM-dependent RNA methyltransferase [Bacilli bacterium]